MSEIDLFLFDLDGTVTKEELLPRIARAIGEEHAIADLTRRTIAGDVPFESSLRERVKILGKANVTEVAEIVAGVELEPEIECFLKKNAHRSYIVTGNLDVWLAKLVERLPVPILCSKARSEGNRIVELTSVIDKGQAVRSLGNGRFCAVGEGHNDLGMFEASAFSIAYGGVHDPAPGLYSVASHAIFNAETLCRLLSRL